MTLVVAQTDGKRIGIVGDTLVTQGDMPLPLTQGVVKTYMLPSGVSVSFSNSPEAASDAIRDFLERYPEGSGYSEITNHFATSSRRSGNEYILGFAETAKLVTIKDGAPTGGLEKIAWIGDLDARHRFLDYYRKKRSAPWDGVAQSVTIFDAEEPSSPVHDLAAAMRMLVADGEIKTVGGFLTTASSAGKTFNYAAYCDFFYDQAWLSMFGQQYAYATGEHLEFSVSSVRPTKAGTNVVGFHFGRRKLTFLFRPPPEGGVLNDCTVIRDVEVNQLSQFCRREYGFEFDLHAFAAWADNPSFWG